jgi:hypothetical protein
VSDLALHIKALPVHLTTDVTTMTHPHPVVEITDNYQHWHSELHLTKKTMGRVYVTTMAHPHPHLRLPPVVETTDNYQHSKLHLTKKTMGRV